MNEHGIQGGLARRLPWLLVFRGAVATGLLALTLVADFANWPVARLAAALYGVAIATYLVIILLGLLLRSGISPVVVSAVHLVTALAAALAVVQATGGVLSAFSFLYLLVILDGAIVGSRPVALAVGSAASIAYGAQIVAQFYGITNAGLATTPEDLVYVNAVVTHIAAFYATALLAGHLGTQLDKARAAATIAKSDLSRAEAFHGAVLESLPVGVMSIDRHGIVQSANAASTRILATPVDALVGRPLPLDLRPFYESPADAAELSITVAERPRHLWLGRSMVAYGGALSPHGNRPTTALVFEDRTEVRALAEHLRVRERLASIGQMAAAIAHEIRNPLAAISGSVELMREATDEERAKLQTIVLREIQRLNDLVSDFLVYARPASPQKERLDLAALAREVCSILLGDSAWAGRRIDVRGADSVWVAADPGQVRQVLWNLLRNALEASPPDCTVDVTVTRSSTPAGDEIVVCVRDYGPGLSKEATAHLFEPFWTTKSQGTGLGLAIVQRIVEAHGGTVTLASAKNGGTEARVALPADAAPRLSGDGRQG